MPQTQLWLGGLNSGSHWQAGGALACGWPQGHDDLQEALGPIFSGILLGDVFWWSCSQGVFSGGEGGKA